MYGSLVEVSVSLHVYLSYFKNDSLVVKEEPAVYVIAVMLKIKSKN